MINRKRYTTGAKVFLAMYVVTFIVIISAMVHVL